VGWWYRVAAAVVSVVAVAAAGATLPTGRVRLSCQPKSRGFGMF